MTIELQQVIPTPLKDALQRRQSEVWNQSLVFQQPALVKIKAPSGTGKTTFIHSLYHLRDDFQGRITWDGMALSDISTDQLAVYRQQHISVVFQDLRLFGNITAFENIELKRVLQNPFCTQQRVHAMAEALGIAHIMQQKAVLCSYGEQQRIAIIRALVQPFDWLIMDEPFSHLDTPNARKAAALILEECRLRNAGMVVTDLHEDDYFPYTKQLYL